MSGIIAGQGNKGTTDLHLESIAIKYVLNAEKLTERDKHNEEMRLFRETGMRVIVD